MDDNTGIPGDHHVFPGKKRECLCIILISDGTFKNQVPLYAASHPFPAMVLHLKKRLRICTLPKYFAGANFQYGGGTCS